MNIWQTQEHQLSSNRENRQKQQLLLLILPPLLFLLIFFIIPLLIVFLYSFLEKGTYGGVNWTFTLSNYQKLTKDIYWLIIWRSLWLAVLTTIACLIIGYPLAFFIATRSQLWRNILLLLVIIPFWTNFLVRTYAWMVLLGTEGVINQILISLNIIQEPLKLLFTPLAVSLGLVYGYLPFMILPLYANLERFNFSLIEAAQDLGANDWKTFVKIILPLTSPGIIAGCILVFIPSVGAFITPDLLGGAKTMMIGNLIQNQFLKSRNWPFGSTLSIAMIAVIMIPLLMYLYLSREKD